MFASIDDVISPRQGSAVSLDLVDVIAVRGGYANVDAVVPPRWSDPITSRVIQQQRPPGCVPEPVNLIKAVDLG
jgi:hypothetical protein